MKSIEDPLWFQIKEKIHNPVYESTAIESQYVWDMVRESTYDPLVQTVETLSENIRVWNR